MICVSISEKDKAKLIERLSGVELAEVRLEALSPTVEDVKEVFAQPAKLIATMRPGSCPDEERLRILTAAIEAGAAYVDIELDSSTIVREGVLAAARRNGCKVIVSHHDFERTPDRDELRRIVDDCFAAGADIAKIACVANSRADAARILGLLDGEKPLIAIGMGKYGRITRIAAPLLGSPFTYASQGEGMGTAEGQIEVRELRTILAEIENARG
jgi:3-dehydroquinate dehydratase type I